MGIPSQVGRWLYSLVYRNLFRQTSNRVQLTRGSQLRTLRWVQLGESVTIDQTVRIESSVKNSITLGDLVQLERQVCLSSDSPESKITLGRSVTLRQDSTIKSCQTSSIEIGQFTQVGTHCWICGTADIKIGSNCQIGNRAILRAIPLKLADLFPTAQLQEPISQGIVIEDNCCIGEGVCILAGVTIGEGSMVGDDAIVTDNVPPYSIVVGAPATILDGCLKDC